MRNPNKGKICKAIKIINKLLKITANFAEPSLEIFEKPRKINIMAFIGSKIKIVVIIPRIAMFSYAFEASLAITKYNNVMKINSKIVPIDV